MQPTSTECAPERGTSRKARPAPEPKEPVGDQGNRFAPYAVLSASLAALLWAYWPALRAMAGKWASDPQYSHGFLVPAFAAGLLWFRRHELDRSSLKPSSWGLPLLAVGGLLYLAGGYVYFDWLEAASLPLTLLGLCALAGGRALARWAAPAVGFLVFMLPLPFRLETMLSGPLRSIATTASTYVLQTVGLPAIAEGNVILLEGGQIGVAEACSGLSMLMTFFALTTAVCLVTDRRWTDKVFLLVLAAPIAVAANVARIVVAAVLYGTAGSRAAELFHDRLAPWFMMPLALALLWGAMWFLDRLLVEPDKSRRPAALDLPRRG
jgi:exosortase